MRLSLNTYVTNISHGENQEDMRKIMKNSPTIAKISCSVRVKEIMKEDLK